ncbi:sarcosine oxidase subunit gamma [Gymnodinialimonas sp. 2305UL16-5]|uniref:sarcosine oxidase subunit gamma n=1 Tax=Gymnodinialimonas mytili TaxID=3126503 RepID=UPI0030A60FF8
MASLTALSPFDGLLPLVEGSIAITEITCEAITWLAPLQGQDVSVSDALSAQISTALPTPNRATGTAAHRAVWAGPSQFLVLGPALTPIPGAAMVDQTSAWAVCTVDGVQAAEILARLVPIDLRDSRFAIGHAARTLLGHMTCLLIRTDTARYDVLVFRSMAGTAAHELERALRMVTARGG